MRGLHLQSLAALPTPGMRHAAVGAFFDRTAPEDAAAALDAVLRLSAAGDPGARVVILDIALWILESRAPATLVEDPHRPRRGKALEAVLRAALAEGRAAVASILATGPGARALPPGGRLAEVSIDIEAPIDISPRNAATVGRDLHRIERLRRHDDARMIRRVIRLPSLRARDVALIAARRPTNAAIARAIALSPRWMLLPAVRRALAENPFTPVEIAAPILPTLDHAALVRLSHAGTAAPPIAEAARALLALRDHAG